jgi:hypothetical protein
MTTMIPGESAATTSRGDNYDPDNEDHVARRHKTGRVKRDNELNDLRKILQTPEGRRVIWRILSQAEVFKQTFNPDPHWAAFNEGKRRIGLWLYGEIPAADEDAFIRMMEEHRGADLP